MSHGRGGTPCATCWVPKGWAGQLTWANDRRRRISRDLVVTVNPVQPAIAIGVIGDATSNVLCPECKRAPANSMWLEPPRDRQGVHLLRMETVDILVNGNYQHLPKALAPTELQQRIIEARKGQLDAGATSWERLACEVDCTASHARDTWRDWGHLVDERMFDLALKADPPKKRTTIYYSQFQAHGIRGELQPGTVYPCRCASCLPGDDRHVMATQQGRDLLHVIGEDRHRGFAKGCKRTRVEFSTESIPPLPDEPPTLSYRAMSERPLQPVNDWSRVTFCAPGCALCNRLRCKHMDPLTPSDPTPERDHESNDPDDGADDDAGDPFDDRPLTTIYEEAKAS